jgi:hypothetical protein
VSDERKQEKNGKRTPTPGTIPNARDWKEKRPRFHRGPFLRIRNKKGEWVR